MVLMLHDVVLRVMRMGMPVALEIEPAAGSALFTFGSPGSRTRFASRVRLAE